MSRDDELRAMVEYCEAATEGPWGWNDSSDVRGHKGELRAPSPTNGFMLVGAFINPCDGSLIARSRTDLPSVVKELLTARELLRRWADATAIDPVDGDAVSVDLWTHNALYPDTRVFLGGEGC